jgi:hypothetical protein
MQELPGKLHYGSKPAHTGLLLEALSMRLTLKGPKKTY